MLMGVLMGVAVLGEPWPSDPARSMMRIFGIVAIGIAVLLLNAPELRKRTPQTHDPPRRRRKPHKKHYDPASYKRAPFVPP